MTRILPKAERPLRATLRAPGDKSVSHRAALLTLLADGPCRADGWLDAQDTRRSLAAVRALGAAADLKDGVLTVAPPPQGPPRGDGRILIDCGNSGTTARLLLGLLAGWLDPVGPEVDLVGDASLSARPMGRVIAPLRAMGADIRCLGSPDRLPARIRGVALQGARHDLPLPSAQVKSALLLAGLCARGVTSIHGGGGSRDHTERLLAVMGAAPQIVPPDGLRVHGPRRPGPFRIAVPGDPSAAAFFLTAAALITGSRVTIANHALNERRLGTLRVLARAGAQVQVGPATGQGQGQGEEAAAVTVQAGPLRSFTVAPAEVPTLIDEIPVLAVLAARAAGESVIAGAADLRHKESDRLAMTAANLRALGADVQELPDGLRIRGPATLAAGTADDPLLLRTAGDHRIAMAMAVAASVADGHAVLDDPACVAISYPDFFQVWAGLLAGP